MPTRVPSSTYRLQFGPAFGFAAASSVTRYLDALGVGDVYASPLLQARTGSTHGYDLVDPSRLNADLGTRSEFSAWSRSLRRRGMGLLLDIVPNHMAADLQNPWWTDVLRNGQGSAFAAFFDIDWELGGGKVLVPVLGGTYAQILEGGDLRLSVEGREVWLRYFERRFPLRPESVERVRAAGGPRAFNGRVGRPSSFEALDSLVQEQHYRLAFWRVTAEEINYRRFFDVTDLVALRMEEPSVFEAAHRFVLSLVASGAVTGLRIDHVDGLRDPLEYLQRLQDAAGAPLYVVVEKILGTDERLPPEWPVAGTTGYEFATDLGGLLVDERSRRSIEETYHRSTAIVQSFADIAYDKKRMVMDELFRTELSVLVRRLHELASNDRYGRDLTSSQLWEGLTAVTAGLPVYRTYTRSMEASEIDREHVEQAVAEARKRSAEHDVPSDAFDFIRRVLLLEEQADDEQGVAWLAFVMRWQQTTGAITAKGVEDTAFYVDNRLVSLNEVGGEPPADELITVAMFHERNAARLTTTPHQLTTTTTHDTKRSEDVRARISALSELPDAWARSVARWSRINAPRKRRVDGEPVPDPNEEYLLYQTLLGAWPLADGEQRDFARRVKAYMVKAAREAKVHTTWVDQNPQYEDALQAFVGSLLGRGGAAFRSDFLRLQRRVAHLGMLNSLSSVVLKITSPAVPDLYQGTELWHLRLVDPDNREPVDFELREKLLDELNHRASTEDHAELTHHLLRDWHDARIKLWVTSRSLRFRRDHRSLFDDGDYLPLEPNGPHSRNIVAFARHAGSQWSLTVAPRLTGSLTGARSGRMPLGPKVWSASSLTLPDDAPDTWRNLFTGELVESERPRGRRVLRLRDVFRTSPVTLLTPLEGRAGPT
jgi:(1->4)-alpha-D-glucan 1-alpha-D-glucosylmutase